MFFSALGVGHSHEAGLDGELRRAVAEAKNTCLRFAAVWRRRLGWIRNRAVETKNKESTSQNITGQAFHEAPGI
jgi:hypothetical protein